MTRALLLALALAGCRQALGIPSNGREGDFSIFVKVTGADGASDGASVLLIRDGDQGTVEVLSDQTTQLAAPLADGQRYQIQPNSGNCTVDNGTGTIDNGDADGVTITCDGLAALGSFGFSAPITFDPAFDGTQSTPRPQASVIVQETGWDPASIHAEAVVTNLNFDGQPATGGPFGIAEGNAWTLDVDNAGFSRAYIADPLPAPPFAYAYGKPSTTTAGARFGSVVAASGADLAIATPDDGAGTVFVSTRSGTRWEETQVIAGPAAGARFGAAIAIAGDTMAIGAPGANSVFVFTRTAGTWTPARTLVGPAPVTTTFGNAVAIAAPDRIVVGDPERAGSGAVLDFVNTTAANTVVVGGPDDRFGTSVAVLGSMLLVGAPGDDSGIIGSEIDNSFEDAGAVYSFDLGQLGTPTVHEYLQAIAPGVHDRFGTSLAVATAGTTSFLIVGSPFEDSGLGGDGLPDSDDNTQTAAGAAYLFRRQGTWQLASFVKAPNPNAGDNFGTAVAIAGVQIGASPATCVIAVGAPFEDSGSPILATPDDESRPDSGAIYVYPVALDGVVGPASYGKAGLIGAGDSLGSAIALTSQTLIAGAPGDNSSTTGWSPGHNNQALAAGAVFAFR